MPKLALSVVEELSQTDDWEVTQMLAKQESSGREIEGEGGMTGARAWCPDGSWNPTQGAPRSKRCGDR